jgi:Family of unknown function (DUF6084)
MPDLTFEVVDVEVAPYAAAPMLNFKLRVTNADPEEQVRSVALTTQIRLDVTRRKYSAHEREHLLDLFGEADRWSQTLRNMLWTFVSVGVPSFTGSTVADLPVPCTFDFNVGATKYFYALEDGEIPLSFLFSGTVFYEAPEGNEEDGGWGGLQVAQVSWESEAAYRLPVEVWKKMMDYYYPNSAWLRLRQDTFDRLYLYKMQRGLPTWEQAIESLLPPTSADES